MKQLFGLVIGIFIAAPALAQEQQVCMPTAELAAALKDWYGETPISFDPDTGEQFWASQTQGTWTLVETRSDGTSCAVDTGDDYAPSELSGDVTAALVD